ncbi:MAG TPA: DUF1634 domain-containing protein [Thermodesulfobacteriota bacterium]
MRKLTDEEVHQIIGNILRIAVIVAAVIVFIGGILYLIQNGSNSPEYHVFKGEPKSLRTISGILKELLVLDGVGIIQIGLLLLIATPVVRVIFSVFAFALQRDSIYVVVTLIVLTVLIYSISGGHI